MHAVAFLLFQGISLFSQDLIFEILKVLSRTDGDFKLPARHRFSFGR